MKSTKSLLGLLAFIIAVPVLYLLGQMVLLSLAFGREHHVWHQNLTVTVETPSGEHTGSAVVEVRAAFSQQPLSGNEVEYAYQGEATVVEVAPGKYLFALLGGSEERFFRAARDRFKGKERGEWLYDIPKQTEPVELTGDGVPLMVTFTDITDPTTVTRVDPANLAATFGHGVSLTSVTLAVTEDPVTEGRVEAVLGWLPLAEFIIPPELQPQYVKDMTVEHGLMPSDFIDWQTLKAKREGNN